MVKLTQDILARNSLRVKVFFVTFLAFVLVGGLFIYGCKHFLTDYLADGVRKKAQTEARIQANLMATPIWNLNPQQAKSFAISLEQNPYFCGLTVIDEVGAIFMNYKPQAVFENLLTVTHPITYPLLTKPNKVALTLARFSFVFLSTKYIKKSVSKWVI